MNYEPGRYVNPLKAKLNPIFHLLALLGAHLIFYVGRLRVQKVAGYGYLSP
jgi:hypothetical protein